jgi:hypothetical protein
MSVEIDPPEQLEFNRPFTQQVARYLKVRNTNDTAVAYKVKTTAPRSYCVRPNSGRIEPGQEVEVQVLLQAMKVDIPPDMKCKDKFLLQSTKINDESTEASLSDLWAQIEKDVMEGKIAKDLIQQKKIKCVWGPPLDTNGASENKSPEHAHVDTPVKSNGVPIEANTPSVLPPQPPQTFSTPSAVPPVVPPIVSHNATSTSSTSSVEAQLLEAKAQIAALTKQLEVTGGSTLRQRNNPSSTTTTTASAPAARPSSAREVLHSATEQGVPIKIVAYLCLAAFLLAYLFF